MPIWRKSVAILILLTGAAAVRAGHGDFDARLRATESLTDDAALAALECILADIRTARLERADRQTAVARDAAGRVKQPSPDPRLTAQRESCYRAIAMRLKTLTPPLPTAAEAELLQMARRQSDHADEVLRGRYTLLLCNADFATAARAAGFAQHLDLAYLALRETFGVDPVQRRGHRYVIWFPRTKPRGHTTDGGRLTIWIGVAHATRPDAFFQYVHELGHAFLWDFHGNPIFAAGFGEGWCDFCKAIAADRLDFLGPPFADQYPKLAGGFRDAGQQEYLQTRLPIERIVGYAPATSLLVALLETTRATDGPLDWTPFERMLRDLADKHRPRPPDMLWPAWQADTLRHYFAPYDVTNVLREYRYPPEALGDWSLEQALSPADTAEPVHEWMVLGPIPDPQHDRLTDDPLDIANFTLMRSHEIDGQTYTWQTLAAKPDGVLPLGQLPGARDAARFYLVARLPASQSRHATFFISSDDDVAVWLDGAPLHTFNGNRGVQPRNPDRAFATISEGKVVAVLANRGGATGFQLRFSPTSPYDRYAPLLRDPDAAVRRGVVDYLGSRLLDNGQRTPLLIAALADEDAAVRARAAWGLAGCRNDAAVVDALVQTWSSECDDRAAAAVRAAVAELTLQQPGTAAVARDWWPRQRTEYEHSHFVECEYARLGGDAIGGFYGNEDGACGGQTIARGWGSDASHSLRVRLRASTPGPRQFVIRYSAARDCSLAVRIGRDAATIVDRPGVALPRTPPGDWRCARVDVPPITPGWYTILLHTPRGTPALDVLGWTAGD
jgi:hypothetical protein